MCDKIIYIQISSFLILEKIKCVFLYTDLYTNIMYLFRKYFLRASCVPGHGKFWT